MLPPIKVGRTGDTQLSREEVRHPARDPCPRDTEEGYSVVGAALDLPSTKRSWVSGLRVKMKAMGANERACDERAPPGHVGGDPHRKDREWGRG